MFKANRVRIGCVLLLLAGAQLGCRVGVGDRMPDWALSDLAGQRRSFSEFAGKVVVLEFWATWCAPCLAVSPHMQALHEKYANRGVVVLAVHYDDAGEPKRYMQEHGFTFTVLDGGLSVARGLGVSQIPTVLIVGPDGRVAHRQTGFGDGDEKELERVVLRLLASTGS